MSCGTNLGKGPVTCNPVPFNFPKIQTCGLAPIPLPNPQLLAAFRPFQPSTLQLFNAYCTQTTDPTRTYYADISNANLTAIWEDLGPAFSAYTTDLPNIFTGKPLLPESVLISSFEGAAAQDTSYIYLCDTNGNNIGIMVKNYCIPPHPCSYDFSFSLLAGYAIPGGPATSGSYCVGFESVDVPNAAVPVKQWTAVNYPPVVAPAGPPTPPKSITWGADRSFMSDHGIKCVQTDISFTY